MAATSSPPHSPPTNDHQPDEACQVFFVTQLVSTLLLGLSILFVSRKTSATPRVDHDRSWTMVKLLLDVGFWYSAPATLIFLAFEVLVPRNSLTHSYEMVCIQVASSSSFPWVMLLFAWCTANVSLSLKRAYLAAEINTDVGLAPSNNEDDEEEPPKMLMIGGLAFGLIFDAIQNHQRQHMKAAPIMVDHAGQKQYIRDKVAALNLVDGKKQHNGVEHGDYVLPLAAEKLHECILDPVQIEGDLLLGVPLQTNSVDKVVVTPGFREQAPIAHYFTSETTKASRMAEVFKEACRVLKPGGVCHVYEGCGGTLLAEADLKDLGCEDITIDKVTSIPSGKYFCVRWTKPEDSPHSAPLVEEWQRSCKAPMPCSVAMAEIEDDEQQQDDDNTFQSTRPRHKQQTLLTNEGPCDDHTTAGRLCCAIGRSSSSCWQSGITLSAAFQFMIWVGLVFAAAGCYSYLMFKPSRNTLPFAQLSMFFPILTTVYPVVAHVVRYRIKYIIIDDHTERIINHGWHRSSCAASCKTFAKGLLCEVSGIGAAFLFSVVDWVCMYVAQLLLRLIVEDVGNSFYAAAVVGPLGLVLTLVLTMKLHHDHSLRLWKRELTSREIDPEKFKQMRES